MKDIKLKNDVDKEPDSNWEAEIPIWLEASWVQ